VVGGQQHPLVEDFAAQRRGRPEGGLVVQGNGPRALPEVALMPLTTEDRLEIADLVT